MALLTTRKVATLASLALVAGLAMPNLASAKPITIYPCWKFGTCGPMKPKPFYKPHYGYGGPGWGYGAAAMGGLAVGMIAASAASVSSAGGECFIERRRVEDEEGNVYIRRVRICE